MRLHKNGRQNIPHARRLSQLYDNGFYGADADRIAKAVADRCKERLKRELREDGRLRED